MEILVSREPLVYSFKFGFDALFHLHKKRIGNEIAFVIITKNVQDNILGGGLAAA
jgi:hypothetical protein